VRTRCASVFERTNSGFAMHVDRAKGRSGGVKHHKHSLQVIHRPGMALYPRKVDF
jgi:hypothetical protein